MPTIECTLASFGFRGVSAPAVQAYFYIPKIDYGSFVTFLIDTGASGTCLHGPVALYLQKRLKKQTIQHSQGIGGKSAYYHERVILTFTDITGRPVSRGTSMGIQKLSPWKLFFKKQSLKLPSLLGRDILSRSRFVYDASNNIITMELP